jgi:hypothetical protein
MQMHITKHRRKNNRTERTIRIRTPKEVTITTEKTMTSGPNVAVKQHE